MPFPSSSPPAAAPGLFVGTSGYSYAEWILAGFYPPGTAAADMLALYARRFGVVELNFTWYRMPDGETLERMLTQVPEDFLFAVKLTRTMTHEVDPKGWRQEVRLFRDGIAPLRQNKQLAAILVQLPPSFTWLPENRAYLAELLDALAGLPLAVEFRHASWARDSVFAELDRRGASLASVDEPALPNLFPALHEVTGDFFYVRFHGRNRTGWRSGVMQKKFDYLYSDGELHEWLRGHLPAMLEKAARGFVFFNNHVAGQAPRNAESLVRLLRQEGLPVRPAGTVPTV